MPVPRLHVVAAVESPHVLVLRTCLHRFVCIGTHFLALDARVLVNGVVRVIFEYGNFTGDAAMPYATSWGLLTAIAIWAGLALGVAVIQYNFRELGLRRGAPACLAASFGLRLILGLGSLGRTDAERAVAHKGSRVLFAAGIMWDLYVTTRQQYKTGFAARKLRRAQLMLFHYCS